MTIEKYTRVEAVEYHFIAWRVLQHVLHRFVCTSALFWIFMIMRALLSRSLLNWARAAHRSGAKASVLRFRADSWQNSERGRSVCERVRGQTCLASRRLPFLYERGLKNVDMKSASASITFARVRLPKVTTFLSPKSFRNICRIFPIKS